MFGTIGGDFFKSKPTNETGNSDLVYIFLPASFEPDERFENFETPLDAELKLAGVGWISGGGSLLSEQRQDGSRHIEFCGIDAEVTNLVTGRALLRIHLPNLGCPSKTALWYVADGQALQDEYDGREWYLELPRAQLHPGFGI